jgi:hypothetical protein
MGVIQPIITAGPPSEYSHHCLMKDTRWTVRLVHGSDTMLNVVDSCIQVEMCLLPNGHTWLPPQHMQKETLPHSPYELCTLCDITCENINPGMQDKSSIIDWHPSLKDILFLLKTVIHNMPSSNWITERGRVTSKMEVRQISCYHTNLADASTPSKIWDSHSGDRELCCRSRDVTFYAVVEDPWCLHLQMSTMKRDAADSSETLLLIYRDNDVTFHEHASPKPMLTLNTTHFFCLISNDTSAHPYSSRQKTHGCSWYMVGIFSFMLVYLTEIILKRGILHLSREFLRTQKLVSIQHLSVAIVNSYRGWLVT